MTFQYCNILNGMKFNTGSRGRGESTLGTSSNYHILVVIDTECQTRVCGQEDVTTVTDKEYRPPL